MHTVRSIIRKYDIHPRRNLGQSFLEDKNIIQKIIDLVEINPEDTIVEIGAGLGIMTDYLAAKAGKVIAIDIDQQMISILQERLKHHSQVKIIAKDVLSYDFSTCLSGGTQGKLKIVGNIPYNISTQILFHLLAFRQHIDSMVLMFQKEVVDRIVAFPGTKTYGIPSVFVSMYGIPSREFTVPASCFYPRPSITSAVLKIILREKPFIELADDAFFLRMVKIAFSKRRKTILNNLRLAGLPGCSEEEIEALLKQTGIEGGRRGETLSPEEFGRLSNAFFRFCNSKTGRSES